MSISLSPSLVEQFSLGGIVNETNNSSALVNISLDYQTKTMTCTFATGSLTNGSINVGPHGSQAVVVIDLNTGSWSNLKAGTAGTFDGTAVATLIAGLKNLRNGLETAAVNQSILLGTQVPWS